ncbi:hypothetical protein Vretifemale_2546 [Volvox reticuliferus]|nr:hypothetical protein Vretifemale_2546 [Volvox reticuliferus]
MSSLHRALPVIQPTNTLFSPAFPSIDASLAGTCGGLLDIRPLPHLLASRRLSLEGKQAEAQVIRKSVSFSLRARGPGAGYNSTSPDQQSPPLQRPDSHPEQLNSSGGRNGAGLDKDKQSPLGGGNYRVLLVDSPQHSEKVVVRAICAVVPIADEVHARNCYCTSKQLGMAIITTALKEHAELYR